MYLGKRVFSQLMDFLPVHQFRSCVERYSGNRHVESFTCLEQFLCMAFAQLSHGESLRDIESCIRAIQRKLYPLGIRSKVSRSSLADANEKRDWRIYADFAQALANYHITCPNNLGLFVFVTKATFPVKASDGGLKRLSQEKVFDFFSGHHHVLVQREMAFSSLIHS